MKVKIIKQGKPSYWYADKIGQEFKVEVYKYAIDHYKVTGTDDCIRLEDCEIVKQDEYLTWAEGDTIVNGSQELIIEGFFNDRIIFYKNDGYRVTKVKCIELFNLGYRLKKERDEGYYSVFHKIGQEIAYYDGVNWYLVGDLNAYKVTEFSSIGDKKIEL